MQGKHSCDDRHENHVGRGNGATVTNIAVVLGLALLLAGCHASSAQHRNNGEDLPLLFAFDESDGLMLLAGLRGDEMVLQLVNASQTPVKLVEVGAELWVTRTYLSEVMTAQNVSRDISLGTNPVLMPRERRSFLIPHFSPMSGNPVEVVVSASVGVVFVPQSQEAKSAMLTSQLAINGPALPKFPPASTQPTEED